MAFVGPPQSGGGWDRARPVVGAALTVLAAALVAGGAMGDDVRWLGAVALSEVVVTRALWWSGTLVHRPWVRLGLRLSAAAAVLGLLGIAMPAAPVVASVFLASAVGCVLWLAVLYLAKEEPRRRRQVVATMALAGAVGLWFAVVGVPPSGWSPLVAMFAGATALDASRVLDGRSATGEEV